MASGGRMSVMVVVPAFAEGDQRYPPVIAGVVTGVKRRLPHIWDAEFTAQVA